MSYCLSSITYGNNIHVLEIFLEKNDPWRKMVLIYILNILVERLTQMQTLFHSCKPFANFSIQVMVFCKLAWACFKLTLINLLHTLKSWMIYCVALNIACPKQEPIKKATSFNGNQLFIDVKAMVRRLSWSLILHINILSNEPKDLDKTFNYIQLY